MSKRYKILIVAALLFALQYNFYTNDYPQYFIEEKPEQDYHFMQCHMPNDKHIEIEEYISMPEYPPYDINLPVEIQQYIWELCGEYEISYELVLSVIYNESKFNTNAKNVNRNGTVDRGLMQINSQYEKDHAKNAGVQNFNPYNPYQNVKVGINVLASDRNYWRSKGLSEESVYVYTILSYNKGRQGAKNYIEKYQIENNEYIQKVSQYKYKIESGYYE